MIGTSPKALLLGLTVAFLGAGCSSMLSGPTPNTTALPLAAVPAPVPPDGYVAGQPTHLQFMLVADIGPAVKGISMKRGDALLVVLPLAFRRNAASPIQEDSDETIVLTKGWPQAPVKQAGQYRIFYDAATNTIGARAQTDVAADGPNSPGIKIIHLRGEAFINPAAGDYPVEVRLVGQDGGVQRIWKGKISVLAARMKARLAPTNFHLGPGMNGDFQKVGLNQDTPLLLGLYLWDQRGELMNGVGVALPDLARFPKYTGGLLIQDSNSDKKLDPSVDRVIGGIVIEAPSRATGQAVSSPLGLDGKPILSGEMPRSTKFPAARGGGKPDRGLLPIVFRSGNIPGLYRPTVELIDGNSYKFTIQVE